MWNFRALCFCEIWWQRSNFQRSKVPPSFLDGPNYSWSWRRNLILVSWKSWKFRKKLISISANCKQKRDLNLKKVLDTLTQRDIRSAASIGYFILDFYFFLPNCGSPFQIKSSSIDSSNINKRFQSWWVLGDTYSMKLSNFGFNWLYGFEKINLSTESAQTKPNLDESWVGFGSPSSEYSTSNPTSQIPFPKIISNKKSNKHLQCKILNFLFPLYSFS